MSLKILNKSSFMKIRRTTLWRSNLKKHLNYSHLTTLFAQKTKKKSCSFFFIVNDEIPLKRGEPKCPHLFFLKSHFIRKDSFCQDKVFDIFCTEFSFFVSLSFETSRCSLHAVAYICIKRANHTILIHIPHGHQNNLNIRQHLSH